MKINDLDRLCVKLDEEKSGIENYEHLIDKLLEQHLDKDKKQFKKVLLLHKKGGGNLGLYFMKMLFAEGIKVREFQQKADDLKSTKIIEILKKLNVKGDALIGDLRINEIESIATYLNSDTPGIFGWRHFAEKFDFDEIKVQQIENMKAVEGSFSPSKAMFKDLPNYRRVTIHDVRVAMVKRKPVVSILDEATRTLMSSQSAIT